MESVQAELCFPHLPNSSCIKPQAHLSESALVYTLLTIISTLTVALNLLVIISISHFRQLRSSTNLILLSLSVSDFLIGLVVIPGLGYIWRNCWFGGDVSCALFYLLPASLTIASLGTIVHISVDRYVAICYLLYYQRKMTDRAVGICISVCWIYSLSYGICMSMDNLINAVKYKTCEGACKMYFSTEVMVFLCFLLPVSIIIVLYMRVFVVAVAHARAMRSQVTASTKTSKKSEIKAARNLGIIVVVYILCYCPFYCIALSGFKVFILGVPVEIVMIFLVYLNSCINPIIYALLYPWFRKAMKLIVTLQILKQGSCDFRIR